jgi:molybdate transport system substrate-binding protein
VTRTVVAAALAAVALTVASSATSAPQARITVFAAASLTDVFPKIDRRPRYSFAGSNTLAAQIQQGAPADVFASANTARPQQLYDQKLCSKPVVFTRNKLVVIVPRSNPAQLHTVYDLTRNGVKIVVADPGVPVGSYTVQVLQTLHLLGPVMSNVVSRETDVRGVLAKIVLGEADAGFVYSTDAKAVAGDVKAIKIPKKAEPGIKYGICVIAGSEHLGGARAFVKRVLSRRGQAKLRAAGFLPRR